MNIILEILSAIGIILLVFMSYKAIFFIIGLCKKKTFKPAETKHKYGICIAARNEEKVIKNILESILNQDYPLDQLTVFVVADNCTDNTAQITRDFYNEHQELNVVVYEHNDPNERTKGFALRYLFDQIKNDYGIEAYEGYFIFDADNVLAPNYVNKMNDVFDEGNKIITSFRNSKNFHQNWISYGYAMHWMRTCLTENRAKAVLNQACRIQGTGFLFANELVKDGWKYTSLTEDRSFCTDAVIQNYRITYCDDAIFYDEQPYKLKVALRQRVRWAKGHLQSTVENCPKLLRNMFKKDKCFTTTYDCFWLNFPYSVEGGVRKLIRIIIELVMAIMAVNFWGWLGGLLFSYVTAYLERVLSSLLEQISVFIIYRKRIGKMPFFKTLLHIVLFPMFDRIGKWSNYVALFKKVEWKPIPHDTVMDISQINEMSQKESGK